MSLSFMALWLIWPLAPLAFCIVVWPLFFPGGSVGDLAVNGTVNDLAVSGEQLLLREPA
ncbi:MAG TPA: hypothetical protein VF532_03140 [Candidatus Angelobacter sp.]